MTNMDPRLILLHKPKAKSVTLKTDLLIGCNDVFYAGKTIVKPLIDLIIEETKMTTITCEALGYPPPTIVWNRIDGNLSDRILVSDSVSVPTGNGNVTRVSVNLTITNAYREDTGVYTCSANNSIGSDNKNVNITVQCKH